MSLQTTTYIEAYNKLGRASNIYKLIKWKDNNVGGAFGAPFSAFDEANSNKNSVNNTDLCGHGNLGSLQGVDFDGAVCYFLKQYIILFWLYLPGPSSKWGDSKSQIPILKSSIFM